MEAWLRAASCLAARPLDAAPRGPLGPARVAGAAVGASHPRLGRIVEAITRVLRDNGGPMPVREVHARVEALLDEPVLRSSVKATLAGHVAGQAPRFVRVARGIYRTTSDAHR